MEFFSSFVPYFSLLFLLLVIRSKLTCIESNCGDLILTGHQVYTKAILLTSAGQGKYNKKLMGPEKRPGRVPSPVRVMAKRDLGKLTDLLPNRVRVG